MFYGGTGSTNSLASLQGLIGSITPQTFQGMTSIPPFSPSNQQITNLLPQNFISISNNGIPTLPNPSNFLQGLDSSIASIAPNLVGTATGLLNSLVGKTLGSVGNFLAGGIFNDVFNQLIGIAQGFSTLSNNQMLDILNNNISAQQIGSLNASVAGAFNQFTNISPTTIRNLATNPQLFNNQINSLAGNAQQNLTQTAQQMASTQVNNPGFSNSGQFPLQQYSLPAFSGNNQDGTELRIRRTVYWSYGPGTDSYSAAKMSSTGRVLAEGISAAVDPSIIPYLSRIVFPDIGDRVATDTGGAVKRRVASGGRLPIVDIYFENRQNALAFANQYPKEVTIKFYPPKTRYQYSKGAPPAYGSA